MTVSPEHVDYLLRLGDSSLVLGQRLGEWTGHGPVLEEDIAMANIALDFIGQARLLLTHAGKLEAQLKKSSQSGDARDEAVRASPLWLARFNCASSLPACVSNRRAWPMKSSAMLAIAMSSSSTGPWPVHSPRRCPSTRDESPRRSR